MRKKTLQSILWHFCDQVLKKNLKLTSKISLIMQKKSFQIFQKEFFSNSTSFLLKKSYIPSNIAPFNYPGTLRVIGPGSGPGPGNGKSQKTGSGPGTPLPSISGYPGNSLPGPTLECTFLVQFLTLKNLNKIELANCIAADIVNLPYNWLWVNIWIQCQVNDACF